MPNKKSQANIWDEIARLREENRALQQERDDLVMVNDWVVRHLMTCPAVIVHGANVAPRSGRTRHRHQ